MKGFIHLYTGNGKGKTTAGVGLAVRFAGNGGKVLYTQFLKNDNSNELSILKTLKHITFLPSGQCFGFSFRMTDETKKLARAHYTAYLETVLQKAKTEDYGMLVLDEIIPADHLQFIPHQVLIDFLKKKPEKLEVVMTGRNASEDIMALSDYVSEIQCIRHPYERGIKARDGIEK